MSPPNAAPGPAVGDERPLRSVATALRRRAVIVVLVALALPAAALSYALRAEQQYTATAKLLFRDPGFDEKLLGGRILAPSADPAREAATNIGLVSLETVSSRAARVASVRTRGLTADEIRAKVTVAAEGQSNVVTIAAVDADPVFAARLANTIARQYIVFRRDADRSKINEAIRLVRRQRSGLTRRGREAREGRALSEQVEQLRVLAALQTGNAELVQRALTPRSPSSPKPVRSALVALLLGLALGSGLALLRDRLDRRLRSREDAEALLGRPVLGTIAESGALRRDGGGALALAGREADAFRTLRANLRYYDIDRDIRSLLVTSSAPGDGKSTVARHLAATAAAAGVSAVLVEADLRRPALRGRYPVVRELGLSEVLTAQAPLAAAIQSLAVTISGAPSGRFLDVVAAGAPPPNPTDLLESDRMRALLAELHERYDLVVVDSSPVTLVPDSLPLLGQVDGVLVVVRATKTTIAATRRLRDQLANLAIEPLGIVMNGTAPAEHSAYGYYAYAPAAPRSPAPAPAPEPAPREPAINRVRADPAA